LAFDEAVLGLTVRRRGCNLDSMLLEKFVNFPFYKTGVKITSNSGRNTSGVYKEGPEGVDDGFGGPGLETIRPGVPGTVVHQREGIFMPFRTSTIAVADVHPYGV
jgi:hypothetical protein